MQHPEVFTAGGNVTQLSPWSRHRRRRKPIMHLFAHPEAPPPLRFQPQVADKRSAGIRHSPRAGWDGARGDVTL